MSVQVCGECGLALLPGDRFCGACGAPTAGGDKSDDAATGEVAIAHTGSLSLTKPSKVPNESASTVEPSASGTPVKRKRLIGIAVGVLSVVLLVSIGVAVGNAMRVAQLASYDYPSSADEAELSVSPDPGTTPDSGISGGEPTSAPVVEPTLYFQSNSGNIRCQVDPAGVICQQPNIKYVAPSQTCPGPSGAVVGVSADGVTWPCLGTEMRESTVQSYDVPFNAYGYTCIINYDLGITCTNGSGRGFTMEYERGIQTF